MFSDFISLRAIGFALLEFQDSIPPFGDLFFYSKIFRGTRSVKLLFIVSFEVFIKL